MAITPTHRTLHRAHGVHLSYCRCGAGPEARPFEEQHNAYSVSLVDRGVFSYRNGAGDAVLGPGWLMLGNPGDAYTCSHEHNDGGGDDCIVLTLSATTFQHLFNVTEPRDARFKCAALPPLPRVAALFRTLSTAAVDETSIEEASIAVIESIQQALSGERPRGTAIRNQRDYAVAAARYIEQHASEPLSLDAVARSVGLSPYHFLRVFRQAIGVTPHQYLLRARLVRAVALLRDTTLPVTTISYESGWTDLSNFIRLFRREIGCSPRDFRRGRMPTLGRSYAPAA